MGLEPTRPVDHDLQTTLAVADLLGGPEGSGPDCLGFELRPPDVPVVLQEPPPTRVLDEPSAVAGSPSARSRPTNAPPFAAGCRIGNYLLLERLASTRQGVVWRAAQVEHPFRQVALKIFRRERRPERLYRVFALCLEAQWGGPLAGTALLPLHDFGVADDHLFAAMPLLDGFLLHEVIAQRRLRLAGHPSRVLHRLAVLNEADYLREVARVMARIARGMGHAHEMGLVHCDIKPSNIFLDRYRVDGEYLIDFGVSRFVDDPPPPRPWHGSGTPMYMAPEKLRGDRPLDETRCDIYAMGVTLFELATLALPFVFPPDLEPRGRVAYLAEARALRPKALRPRVPLALEAIIRRAMAPDLADRYGTSAALADDLERFRSGGRRRG